jgi:hypothetical protein
MVFGAAYFRLDGIISAKVIKIGGGLSHKRACIWKQMFDIKSEEATNKRRRMFWKKN